MFNENSTWSMMRVMAFLTTLTALGIACFKPGDNVILVSTMLTIAFAGKTAQKFKEG